MAQPLAPAIINGLTVYTARRHWSTTNDYLQESVDESARWLAADASQMTLSFLPVAFE
jgi:hypothetical protein